MKTHYKYLIASLISVLTLLCLSSCSSMMSNRLPSGSVTMAQAYNDAINGSHGDSLNKGPAKLLTLRRQSQNYNVYTRTQENEINSQFPQLPNPSIVMYVYPHEAGTRFNKTPIPGYSTVFPMYQHVYYAMPGEVALNVVHQREQ